MRSESLESSGGENFQCDVALQRGVVGSIHFAHATLAEQGDDFVVA